MCVCVTVCECVCDSVSVRVCVRACVGLYPETLVYQTTTTLTHATDSYFCIHHITLTKQCLLYTAQLQGLATPLL